MQVRCPHCQTSLALDDSSSLAAVDCATCGSSFSLLGDNTANVIASASDDRSIKLWSLDNGERLGELHGHAESVLSLTFSPDGKTLVSGSSDKTIKLWDMVTGEPKTTLKGHRYRVWSVAFSPDGWTLASSSYALKLWRAAKPEELPAAK